MHGVEIDLGKGTTPFLLCQHHCIDAVAELVLLQSPDNEQIPPASSPGGKDLFYPVEADF